MIKIHDSINESYMNQTWDTIHDSSILCATWPIRTTCDMTHSCGMTHSYYVRHDSFVLCATWLKRYITQAMSHIWIIHEIRYMTHSYYLRHDSSILCATWHTTYVTCTHEIIHMQRDSYCVCMVQVWHKVFHTCDKTRFFTWLIFFSNLHCVTQSCTYCVMWFMCYIEITHMRDMTGFVFGFLTHGPFF